jgi:hypothetical protein
VGQNDRRRIHLHIASFRLQKAGNAPEENDDACYPLGSRSVRAQLARVAVSDGATEGFQSGRWATYLVEAFSHGQSLNVDRITRSARRRWSKWFQEYLEARAKSRPIQWWEEPGLERGAFASLIGLQLKANGAAEGGSWEAVAVGDSCLFHVRDSALLQAFPMQESSAFTNRPLLIPTNAEYLDPERDEAIVRANGSCASDDTFYLTTDALAKWLLSRMEDQRPPWRLLRDLDTDAEVRPFDEWVQRLRMEEGLRNDDVTLVRIDLH